jgi:hypothetical protein
LTNKIYGEEIWKEWNTSEKTGYGMHTTRSSTIYEWKKHSFVIDTPWITNLNLFEVNRENLKFLFSRLIFSLNFGIIQNEQELKIHLHALESQHNLVQLYEYILYIYKNYLTQENL